MSNPKCTLPVHPYTGLTAVGVLDSGRIVWPISGGSEPVGEPGAQPPAAPPAPPAAPPAADPPKPGPPAAETVDSLPEFAQKIIRDARKEAGDARAAAKYAGDAAQADLLSKMQVALGLKPDPAADPAALAEQLATTQAEAKMTAIKLAVYQGSTKQQGDPAALLDSNSFMSGVAKLDHKADDFVGKVDSAIKDAIAANPKLKVGLAPPVSGGQFPGGSGEGNKKTRPSLGAAIAAAYQS